LGFEEGRAYFGIAVVKPRMYEAFVRKRIEREHSAPEFDYVDTGLSIG
jgi:hypothetical protein